MIMMMARRSLLPPQCPSDTVDAAVVAVVVAVVVGGCASVAGQRQTHRYCTHRPSPFESWWPRPLLPLPCDYASSSGPALYCCLGHGHHSFSSLLVVVDYYYCYYTSDRLPSCTVVVVADAAVAAAGGP